MNDTMTREDEAIDASLLGASRQMGVARRRHPAGSCACERCRSRATLPRRAAFGEAEAADESEADFESFASEDEADVRGEGEGEGEGEGDDEFRRGRGAMGFARPRFPAPAMLRPRGPMARPVRRPVWPAADAMAAPAFACPPQRSEYVRWVQSALNRAMNAGLPITGAMSGATRDALRQFQGRHQLPADGIAGPQTRDALVRAEAAPAQAASSAAAAAEPAHETMLDELLDESHETGGPWDPVTEIEQALRAKRWSRAIELALEAGQHDEGVLTNLVFFEQNPTLPHAPLDPKHKDFKKLSAQWGAILKGEVRPAIQRMSTDYSLAVGGDLVTERDADLSGAAGKKFQDVVRWAAAEVDLNPGFLAAVLLAEVGSAGHYLKTVPVSSFFTGTDDFLAQRKALKDNVPAFAKIGFDASGKLTNINENGRTVQTVLFNSGRDAALATAVYLKYAQIKLRNGAAANGGSFDKIPAPVQFALNRISMAAGHGGLELNGSFVWFAKKGSTTVRVPAGTKGAFLVGVTKWLDRVLKGEDILVRDWTGRKFPDTVKITSRNATILVAQALHLSEWFFGIQLVARPKRPVRPW
jgi:hypothetical protein